MFLSPVISREPIKREAYKKHLGFWFGPGLDAMQFHTYLKKADPWSAF